MSAKQVIRIEWDRPEGRLRLIEFSTSGYCSCCELWVISGTAMPVSTRVAISNQKLGVDLVCTLLNASMLFKEINV